MNKLTSLIGSRILVGTVMNSVVEPEPDFLAGAGAWSKLDRLHNTGYEECLQVLSNTEKSKAYGNDVPVP